MIQRRWVLRAALLAWAAAGLAPTSMAQEVVSDAAPYRRPAVFVVPDAPLQVLQQVAERNYRVTVDIGTDGLVSAVRGVEPDDAAFRDKLDQVVRYWLFYPRVDAQRCEKVASVGRVELQYRAGERTPRVFLTMAPLDDLLDVAPPRIVNKPPLPGYPTEELYKGLQGRVLMLSQLNPQGEVVNTEVLLALPSSPGFVSTARKHQLRVRFDAGLAPLRCAVTTYVFKIG